MHFGPNTSFRAQAVFGPARLSAALPFPGSRPKNLGLGRETAAPFRPPPARSVRATRAPSDEIRRSTPRAPRLRRPLGRDPPRTLVHFLPPLLSLLPATASERMTRSGDERRRAPRRRGGRRWHRRAPLAGAACRKCGHAAPSSVARRCPKGTSPAARRSTSAATRASDPAGNRPPRPHGALEGSVSPVRGCEAARDQVPCARSASGTAMAAAMATVVA